MNHLLKLHPQSRLIGDLMVGCGTTAVEATVAGRGGLFSDIDPLSCLLTRAKSHPIDPDALTELMTRILKEAGPLAKRGTREGEALSVMTEMEESTSFRMPSNVFHWFQPYVASGIASVLIAVSDLRLQGRQRDSVLAIIASAVRRLSRADPNTSSGLEVTKIRSKQLKEGLRFDVEGKLKRKAKLLAEGYRQMRALSNVGEAKVVSYDARKWSKLCDQLGQWPDLLVSSPCYTRAIEYWRRQKLENSWLGLVEPEDFVDYKRSFIGMGVGEPDEKSLTPYVKELHSKLLSMDQGKRARELARYFNDSAMWLGQVSLVLKESKGVAYIVVGSNTTHGVVLDIPRALKEISAPLGLTTTSLMSYEIKNSYMQYSVKGDRIKQETVLKMVPAG